MSRFPSTLEWVNSEGGPVILMEKPLLRYWNGCFSTSKLFGSVSGLPGDEDSQKVQSDNGGNLTDYDRACEVDDYLGLIGVGPGLALVLGDEPMQTAWRPLLESGAMLIRWHWANDEDSVVKALSDLSNAIWQSSDLILPVSGDPLILFDSASPGSDIEKSLEIDLPKRQYSIDTAHYQPNKETSLFLHRLT